MNQLSGVKVRLATETVPSVVSPELTGMVTFAAGFVVRTTRNDAPEPPSVVTRPVRLVTLTPGARCATASPYDLVTVARPATIDPSRFARYTVVVAKSCQYILPAGTS